MSFWLIGALNAGAENELPLWKEICNLFYEAYFGTEGYYEHLDMGTGSLLSLRLIILGIFLGIAAGSFVSVFNKRVLGGFVRKLLREECLSPETGKTLPELNYAAKLTIRRAVKKNVNLLRVVRCREEEEYLTAMEAEGRKKYPPFRIDPDRHHFYIPEDMKYMADVKFEAKGMTWQSAIAFSILMIVTMLVLLGFLPNILSLLNDFVGMLKG